jgi:tetratricopeptide (TPR) repeat protein
MGAKDQTKIRLDSWKEIALYLGRGERTVKRWEQERALPVHRLPGGRGSVYAFTVELDNWLRSEREHPTGPASGALIPGDPASPLVESAASANDPSLAAPSPFRRRLAALSVLLLAVVTASVLYLGNFRGDRATGSTTLSAKLDKKPNSGAAATKSADPEKTLARDLYLRGRYEWNKRTPESLDRAFTLFSQALVRDPDFAPAYVGLADTYNLKREFAKMPEKEAYHETIAAARKAIELDDSLAEAHRTLGFALANGEWDFVNGEKEFLRAIQLNPNDPITHLWYANTFEGFDHWDVTLREMDRAQKLDPASAAILADKGNMLFNSGNAPEALQLLQQVERDDPQFLAPHIYLARLFFQTRNYPAFLDEAEKTATLSNDAVLRSHIAAARAGFSGGGERGLLQALYATQKASVRRAEIRPTVLALTCVQMGKKDEAFDLIGQDLRDHSDYTMWLVALPAFVALKDNPRYEELLLKLTNRPTRQPLLLHVPL